MQKASPGHRDILGEIPSNVTHQETVKFLFPKLLFPLLHQLRSFARGWEIPSGKESRGVCFQRHITRVSASFHGAQDFISTRREAGDAVGTGASQHAPVTSR